MLRQNVLDQIKWYIVPGEKFNWGVNLEERGEKKRKLTFYGLKGGLRASYAP